MRAEMRARACACVCVRVRVHARARARVCVRVHARASNELRFFQSARILSGHPPRARHPRIRSG